MKVLITGFDAFGDDDYNPSFEAIKKLPDKINSLQIIKKQLPTKYIDASLNVIDFLNENNVDYVILCGQAAGRKEITLEKFAVNTMDARIKDNAGYHPKDITILESGAVSYETSLNLSDMESYMNDHGISAKISYHAGTFVCNSTYYNLLHKIHEDNLETQGLFIHVPIIHEQVLNYKETYPSVTLEEINEALYTVLEYLSQQ